MFVVAIAAGGFASWYIYGTVLTWVLLVFIAAFVGSEYLWERVRRRQSSD